MKKLVLLIGAAVLVLVATFYGGFFLGRTPPDRPELRGLPIAPPADYWTYPGSRNIQHAGGEKNFSALFVTPASYEEVATFYHRQICTSNSLKLDFDPTRSGSTTAGFSSGDFCYGTDDTQPDRDGAERTIRVIYFSVRSKSYDLAVFVNRAAGEGQTHVAVLYDTKPTP